jgi:YfiR/HmsC-like
MISRLTIAVVLGALAIAGEQAHAVDEYRVKAAFLFNFAKFVEWPPETFASADEPIGICVLGQNPFGSVLEETVRGKVVANRTLVIRQISNTQQGSKCHIVFVSASEGKRSLVFLEELKSKRVLTISETDGVNWDGGVIGLSLKDGRVRIEIDLAAAERAGLRISSKLLSLAEIKKQ